MTYEIYKNPLAKEDYFEKWKNQNDLRFFTEELREYIYQKYLLKCYVFARDKFKCCNKDCKSEEDLTLHHVKFKKNGGEDKVTNAVTLCKKCHVKFHKGSASITFEDREELPAKLRGRTYKVDKTKEINWKQIKFEMKKLRKTLFEFKKEKIAFNEILMLLKFLEVNFDTEDD